MWKRIFKSAPINVAFESSEIIVHIRCKLVMSIMMASAAVHYAFLTFQLTREQRFAHTPLTHIVHT